MRRLRVDPRGAVGLAAALAILLAVAFGPLVSPYGPDTPDFLATLAPPSAAHWFGTDDLGRDVLARVLAGGRVSLLVSVLAIAWAGAIGVPLGMACGYLGGWPDLALMRVVDVLLAFPGILLALGVATALGASGTSSTVAIALINLPVLARLARAQTLTVRAMDYVAASRVAGSTEIAILRRCIAPNAVPPVVVQVSLLLASAILTESYLSFLGLGVQPPTPSWGNMLHDAIGFLGQANWLAWFPGLAIFLAVLAFNLLGDAVRDRLDPNLRL